jgi:hypothetical protein
MKLLLILLAVPAMAFAFHPTAQKDCSPIDLRNENLGQVRDQQQVSWCYAFSAADMLGFTFNEQEKVSAADIAIGYNQTKVGLFVRWLDLNVIHRKDPITSRVAHQNGFNKLALIKAMNEGLCPEKIFPSESWTKMTRTQDGWIQSQKPLDEAMLEIAALHDIKNSLTAENIPYFYHFKNVDAQGFVRMLQTKNVAGFYSALRETVCRDDRRPTDYRWKVKMVVKNPRVFSRISEQLEMGRLVGLDYDSRILKDSSTPRLSFSELHTSPLVGRRWNEANNSCEYLVRDSHGTDCSVRFDRSYDCEAGNIWLGESLIYRSMTSIVYMLSGESSQN